jgi:hypothetical protein
MGEQRRLLRAAHHRHSLEARARRGGSDHRLLREEPEKAEKFYAFVKRVGKGPIRDLLEPLNQNLPSHDAEPGLYSDWGDPRQYSIGDIGVGECAGEVVSRFQFELTAAERLVFEAGLHLDRGAVQQAGETACAAFMQGGPRPGAGAIRRRLQRPGRNHRRIQETVLRHPAFFDPFVGPKFANFFFAAHAARGETFTADTAHHRIAEAQLFIEAVHNCYNKLRSTPPRVPPGQQGNLENGTATSHRQNPGRRSAWRSTPPRIVDILHQWVARQSCPASCSLMSPSCSMCPTARASSPSAVEADFALDHTGGIWGLLYRRKTILPGANQARIAQAISSPPRRRPHPFAGPRFPAPLKFSRTEFELIVNDRGIAPNTAETYAAAMPGD